MPGLPRSLQLIEILAEEKYRISEVAEILKYG